MKAYFKQIQSQIESRIFESKESIVVAVAWFTNQALLTYLTDKAKEGVSVKVLVSNDRLNKFLKTQKSRRDGVEFSILNDEKFLHEKFAVFDGNIVVTGSYNWTKAAEFNNHESILDLDNKDLATIYSNRFNELWNIAKTYQKDLFIQDKSGGIADQERRYKELENSLLSLMKETLILSQKKNLQISTELVFNMIERYGTIGACKKVVEKGNDEENIPSGFYKLARTGNLDKTFESYMMRDEFKVLFPKQILIKAEERLQKFSR